ncbi:MULTISPECIES: hypothetical protein [Photorhabdus]|nr:hypothetical protein [Photorhabdus asymbiotica]
MTGVSECSQQRGNLRDNGYIIKYQYVLSMRLTSQSRHYNNQR